MSSIITNVTTNYMQTTPYSIRNDDDKNIIMYYHTTIRNVGLYTSISLATIVCSYQFIKNIPVFKDINQTIYKLISFLVLLSSLGFLGISVQIIYILLRDINRLQKHYTEQQLNKWKQLPYMILCVQVVLFVVILGIMYLHFLK